MRTVPYESQQRVSKVLKVLLVFKLWILEYHVTIHTGPYRWQWVYQDYPALHMTPAWCPFRPATVLFVCFVRVWNNDKICIYCWGLDFLARPEGPFIGKFLKIKNEIIRWGGQKYSCQKVSAVCRIYEAEMFAFNYWIGPESKKYLLVFLLPNSVPALLNSFILNPSLTWPYPTWPK